MTLFIIAFYFSVENWASELSKQLRTDVDYTTGYTILDIVSRGLHRHENDFN